MYRVEALACCYSRVAKMYVLQDSFIFLYFSSFLERERERGREREREREREEERGIEGTPLSLLPIATIPLHALLDLSHTCIGYARPVTGPRPGHDRGNNVHDSGAIGVTPLSWTLFPNNLSLFLSLSLSLSLALSLSLSLALSRALSLSRSLSLSVCL